MLSLIDLNMLGVTVFIVSSLVSNTYGQKNKENDRNIKWRIKFSPIVFGKDAILFCNLSSTDHCCDNTVTWMKDFDVISHHGASKNSSKYQQIKENDGFSLVIKHFDEKDINCQYACLYGFDTYSSILRINSNDFELRPTNEITKYTIKATQLIVDLNFGKVFPSPQCEIMMNERILQSKSVANETTNGLFLSSHIKLICELQSENCSENISVQCLIGKTHVMKIPILTDCKNLESSFIDATHTAIGNTVIEALLGITLFLAFFSISVPVIICRRKLQLRHKCCVDLEGDEMHNLYSGQKGSECILENSNEDELFKHRCWVPSQRSKDVIKWLQVVMLDPIYLQLAATNLRINYIRHNIDIADNDFLWNVSNNTNTDPSLKWKENSNDYRCNIQTKVHSKTVINYIGDVKCMLITASNSIINHARHFLWTDKDPTGNDCPPIYRFHRIKNDRDLIIAISTFKKTNPSYCLLSASNIRINEARMKTPKIEKRIKYQ